MKSTVLYEQTWHHPMYFEDDRTEEIVLLTKHYRIRRTPRGRVHLDNESGAETYADSAAMVAALEANDWPELSSEADGNPSFVPDEVLTRLDSAKLAASALARFSQTGDRTPAVATPKGSPEDGS